MKTMTKHTIEAKQIAGGTWMVSRNGKPISYHLYRADAHRRVKEARQQGVR